MAINATLLQFMICNFALVKINSITTYGIA